jgi:hypothetical protein
VVTRTGRSWEDPTRARRPASLTREEATIGSRAPEPCAQVRILPRAPHHLGSDQRIAPGHRPARELPRVPRFRRVLPFATGRAREELRGLMSICSRVVKGVGSAGATVRPAGGTSGAVLGRPSIMVAAP